MPYLKCSACNNPMEINAGTYAAYNKPDIATNPKTLVGSAVCRKCGAGTGFELNDNVIVYVSGKSSYGSLSAGLADDVKMLYAEAELCFHSGTPNACAAMCRAAIEFALKEVGYKGDVLFELISDAKTKGKLDDIEVGLAHSSRLMTRGAMHRGEFVSLPDMPSMLSASVRILNKLVS